MLTYEQARALEIASLMQALELDLLADLRGEPRRSLWFVPECPSMIGNDPCDDWSPDEEDDY